MKIRALATGPKVGSPHSSVPRRFRVLLESTGGVGHGWPRRRSSPSTRRSNSCADRMYLNAYVPVLQTSGVGASCGCGVVLPQGARQAGAVVGADGADVADFVAGIEQFAAAHGVDG